ncbi:PepSY domain-containing protein [Echinicola soli]|uniref:PepSY domain-containing protein n=1 Tax=Echinicola soli TaxID=2591634 RepID=A0A514CLS5_9BACT|nr:PepSY-associated TM helix domain-containing protein [Echinicola soli]QDH80644.1 PepSY domain-containing protein [Echinicola soli]
MSNRIYNILFHTHTISGIIISAALYVIFFAGSLSFFRDEIVGWERNEPISENANLKYLDLDHVLDTLDARKGLAGRDVSFYKHFEERRINVNLSAPKDTTAQKESRSRGEFFYLDPETLDAYTYVTSYSLGEFFYRLHFFAQLNLWGTSGYLLAGFVAFFFLFAIVTGVLVHWKKIVSNLYVFRPKASLKNIWTDAHTALGVLGLPYQFVFAVTGCYLIIGTTVLSPAIVTYMYDGDMTMLYDDFGFNPPKIAPVGQAMASVPSVNGFVDQVEAKWPEFDVKSVQLFNYGDQNMHALIEGNTHTDSKFLGRGGVMYNMATGEQVYEVNPYTETSYQDAAAAIITQLHYGDFGGIPLRVVYFILGLVTCFVIISGVLIWLVARDKKHVSPVKRKFNAWLVATYLAICLSMLPVSAFSFIIIKLFPLEFDETRMTFIYQVFFYAWLVCSVGLTATKNNFFINKFCLISGGILGLAVPVANGLTTGNWLWKSYEVGFYQMFTVDFLWLVLGATSLWVASKVKKQPAKKASAKRKKDSGHLNSGVDKELVKRTIPQFYN